MTFVNLIAFDASGNPFTATSVPYGSPYILRFDVTNSASQPCSTNAVPCPTNNLTWTDNGGPPPQSDEQGAPAGTVAGNLKLNSEGYAEDQFIQFPGVQIRYEREGHSGPSPAHNVVALARSCFLANGGREPGIAASANQRGQTALQYRFALLSSKPRPNP